MFVAAVVVVVVVVVCDCYCRGSVLTVVTPCVVTATRGAWPFVTLVCAAGVT